jgi:hypothetical protein
MVHVPCGGEPWTREGILATEAFGYEPYETGERIACHRPVVETVTLLSHAAGPTTRTEVGPAIPLLPPPRPPIMPPGSGRDRLEPIAMKAVPAREKMELEPIL